MSQILGARQGDRELAMRQSHPSIDGYADVAGPNAIGGRTSITRAGRTGQGDDYNVYETNQAFGAYQRDSHAAQDMRNFYDTMDAVAVRGSEGGTAVQRVANITNTEMDLMREFQETEKTKKWEQYWWSTADPSKPWTMNELNKIDPVLVQRKMDAIQEVSQFALDKAIIKHLGHNGDPRLAQLQYMLDQGQMVHMPETVVIDTTPYTRGPLSLFKLTEGARTSLNATSVTLPRQVFRPAGARARIDRAGALQQNNLFSKAIATGGGQAQASAGPAPAQYPGGPSTASSGYGGGLG
jgi:hypothetical protein